MERMLLLRPDIVRSKYAQRIVAKPLCAIFPPATFRQLGANALLKTCFASVAANSCCFKSARNIRLYSDCLLGRMPFLPAYIYVYIFHPPVTEASPPVSQFREEKFFRSLRKYSVSFQDVSPGIAPPRKYGRLFCVYRPFICDYFNNISFFLKSQAYSAIL